MKTKFSEKDYYGNFQTAHFRARKTKDGFVDVETDELLEIKENAIVRLIVDLSDLDDNTQERVHNSEKRLVLRKGSKVKFTLACQAGIDKSEMLVTLQLDEDLFFEKKNNKLPRIVSSRCSIVDLENQKYNFDKEPVFKSLNQAYTQLSAHFNPDGTSHNCNVYKQFFTEDGNKLEFYRYS